MFSIPRLLALDYVLAHAWPIVQVLEHTLQDRYVNFQEPESLWVQPLLAAQCWTQGGFHPLNI